jgi:hypothetical protein
VSPVDLSSSTLETPFHLSFPELVLPPVGARPLSISEIAPIPPPRRAATEAESLGGAKPRRASVGRLALLLALTFLLGAAGVGAVRAFDGAAIDDDLARAARTATSTCASMAKSLAEATATGAFE